MSWFLTNLISAFLLPPLNLLLLTALSLWLWKKRPLLARLLLTLSFALLWLFSTPYFAESMLRNLEGKPYALDTKHPQAEAIVVLGGGTYFHAAEYGGDTVSKETLVRLRYAAKLYREMKIPVLVTGGKPLGNALSEAAQMKQVLENEFNVPVRWAEGESDNTLENARLSRDILKQAGINRIYLVSHAWHLPRAQRLFENTGLQVIPAPTAFTTRYQNDLLAFVPNARALLDSRQHLHEMIGMLWYRVKS